MQGSLIGLKDLGLSSLLSIEENINPLHKDELQILEKLIEVNEIRIFAQKNLKEQMKLFQKQKAEFAEGNQSQKHAFIMVSTARDILGRIKKEHLAYLFPSDYLEELVFFSSIAGKSSPARP